MSERSSSRWRPRTLARIRPSPRWLLLLLVGSALVFHARNVPRKWTHASGYEYEWVAVALAGGHGYSFKGPDRWLGPFDELYAPTAWVEPVQTAVMAACFRVFGERGRLVLVGLNFLWFGIACFVVYELGRRLQGIEAGLAAAVLLAIFRAGKDELVLYIGNAALATLFIALCALTLVWRLQGAASVRRDLMLGALIGLTAITHAATLLFAPVAAALLVLDGKGLRDGRAWASAGVVLFAAAAVISPWTLRNWIAFGELVPIRSGLGQNSHYANPALARTFAADLDRDEAWANPPWRARHARDAVSKLQQQELWRSLANYSIAMVTATAPPAYAQFNEAQRDAVFARQTRSFILSHPGLVTRMVFAKAYGFFYGNWRYHRRAALMALVGALIFIRRRHVQVATVLILAYSVAYLVSAPIYYRYRAPVEPLIYLLWGLWVGLLLQWLRRRLPGGGVPNASS